MSATTKSAVSGSTTKTCTIKFLPQDQWSSAAAQAIKINPVNAPATHVLRLAAPDVVLQPPHIALITTRYWGSAGVRLTVGFLDNPPTDLRARIVSHMNAWGRWANVEFVETASDAQVRIDRAPGLGYWSYLGTDILGIAQNRQTMNLDSFTMNTPDSEFYSVVRHETGHTLGFPHEHLRREIVDRIDPEKAIAYFMQNVGWSRDQTITQVLTPLDYSALRVTEKPDPDSIMCYQLPAEIMKDGVAVIGGKDIDTMDAQFVALIYPKQAGPAVKMASLFPGQALDPGQSVQSDNKLHTLIMQSDGNVVLYDQRSQPLWATNTGGLITPGRFIMQTDGNLVLYDSDGKLQWASKTDNHPGAFFSVQDDGNLVVYRAGSQTPTADNALWASGSNDIWAPVPSPGSEMAQELLNAHNSYRAQVGSPPLAWSDTLAIHAQEWANYLAANGLFQHSGASGEGENLWGGTSHAYSFTQMVSSWGDEGQNCVNGTFPNVSKTGRWEDVGHYTQMVWRNTTQVGCGVADGGNGNAVLVCRYSAPGNVDGEFPF